MEPMPTRDPARFVAAGGAIVLFVLVAAVALLLARFVAATPLDPRVDELAADYRAHPAQFRTIAKLASVDATFGVNVASGSLGSDDISAAELPEYRGLLEALQAIGAEDLSAADHALVITTASEGLAVSGRESGYYYTTSSEVETVTLEVARSPDAPRTWLYPLGDGWYASDYRF